MPELPEVERARQRLEAAARGKSIAAIHVTHPALAARLPTARRRRAIGRIVSRVERRGKHQLLYLDDGAVVHVHFRMTGDWEVVPASAPLPRHTRAALELSDGSRVALVDPRALATLDVARPGQEVLPALGPEPTDPAFSARALAVALARRRGAIKPALLDQRVVAGLGNIYAVEALWRARISPLTPAAGLDLARLRRIVASVRHVLRLAPAPRYSDDARTTRWQVYDREGLPCRRCAAPIARIVQAGRSTYFCPGCQH